MGLRLQLEHLGAEENPVLSEQFSGFGIEVRVGVEDVVFVGAEHGVKLFEEVHGVFTVKDDGVFAFGAYAGEFNSCREEHAVEGVAFLLDDCVLVSVVLFTVAVEVAVYAFAQFGHLIEGPLAFEYQIIDVHAGMVVFEKRGVYEYTVDIGKYIVGKVAAQPEEIVLVVDVRHEVFVPVGLAEVDVIHGANSVEVHEVAGCRDDCVMTGVTGEYLEVVGTCRNCLLRSSYECGVVGGLGHGEGECNCAGARY